MTEPTAALLSRPIGATARHRLDTPALPLPARLDFGEIKRRVAIDDVARETPGTTGCGGGARPGRHLPLRFARRPPRWPKR